MQVPDGYLSKLYTDSVKVNGVFVADLLAPLDDRTVALWGGLEGLGIEFDLYFGSRFERDC